MKATTGERVTISASEISAGMALCGLGWDATVVEATVYDDSVEVEAVFPDGTKVAHGYARSDAVDIRRAATVKGGVA